MIQVESEGGLGQRDGQAARFSDFLDRLAELFAGQASQPSESVDSNPAQQPPATSQLQPPFAGSLLVSSISAIPKEGFHESGSEDDPKI